MKTKPAQWMILTTMAAASLLGASAGASPKPCDIVQARVYADAMLKLKHRTDTVHRDFGTGDYLGNGKAVKYTFQYVAIAKDPRFVNDGMIGTLTIPVQADGTCDDGRFQESSTQYVETNESYTFMDMIREMGLK